jgi:23S rRNA (uracil1939-C5)-methyltransferase
LILKILRYSLFYGKEKYRKVVFHQIKVIDAGAKGVSVSEGSDGKVVFIECGSAGDVVDMQTLKAKTYYEGKAIHS